MYVEDPDAKQVIDVAKGLEGLRRQDGIHAAAVVITKDPLTEYLPIQRKPEPGAPIESAPVVTQYEMGGVESLGLLKMDFLGLRNLDVITDAVAMIERTRGEVIDVDAIPLDDPPTYELLQRGDTIGVFQLESPPMRTLLQRLRPTEFGDVAALIALYRPGPMSANMHFDYADRKNGRKPLAYFHDDAADLLADTYGLMIYQESVLRVAQKFAGYSLAEADKLRKACGKKKRELMVAEREKFVAGCDATGYGAALGNSLFDVIEKFADYAFGKAHSFGYGLITYQTAYFKARYPVEYFACLLTSVKANLDKAAVYLAECRVMGIPVLVPDVNVSQSDFAALLDEGTGGDASSSTGSIPFGLSAVRNVGEGLVELLVREREANGPFSDFFDFCDRVDLNVLNKRTIESLIKAGAFDSMGYPRQGLLMVYESIIDRVVARRRKQAEGQFELFDMLAETPAAAGFDDTRIDIPTIDFDKKTRLAFEREMLGLYVSDHPLMGAEAALRRRTDGTLNELEVAEDGSIRLVGGLITNLQKKWTKKGDLMAVFVLEDLQGAFESMVFPKAMETYGHLLENDAVVVAKCRVDKREDTPKLIAMELEILTDLGNDVAGPVRLRVRPSQATDELLGELKRVLEQHPGASTVILELGDKQVLRLPQQYSVDCSNGLKGALHELLGADAVLV
jgi:DNA polymerase-3 subunit alpha